MNRTAAGGGLPCRAGTPSQITRDNTLRERPTGAKGDECARLPMLMLVKFRGAEINRGTADIENTAFGLARPGISGYFCILTIFDFTFTGAPTFRAKIVQHRKNIYNEPAYSHSNHHHSTNTSPSSHHALHSHLSPTMLFSTAPLALATLATVAYAAAVPSTAAASVALPAKFHLTWSSTSGGRNPFAKIPSAVTYSDYFPSKPTRV